ncbi:MAG: beta-lactam-binding protein with PASTA domain [Polyangiales bacterium]|jgi:beta-lactam-binding protein with PASTA domain
MSDKEKIPPSVAQVIFIAVVSGALASVLTTYGLHALPGQGSTSGSPTSVIVDSDGLSSVDVPSLVGVPSESAGDMVRNAGLRLVVSATEASDMAEGNVIRQSPLAGSTLPTGDAVDVILSSGPAMIEIPDLSGRAVAEARTALTGVGLEVTMDNTAQGGAPGIVVSTSPEAGVEVAAGTNVTVRATPAGIAVPNLVGSPYRRARETLEELGLVLGRVRRRYDERRPDLVITSQEPAAESLVPAGTEIEIVIND